MRRVFRVIGSILRFILRFFGALALLFAALALGVALSLSIEAGGPAFRPLGEWWFVMSKSTLNLMQAVIQRYLLPEIWDPGVQTILLWPAWGVLMPVGFLLRWLGKKRRDRS